MLRTLLLTGLLALAGLVVLKVVFGLLGPLVSALFWLVGMALRVLLVGALAYLVLRVVSPATAQRLRDALR
jgi:hypothetical protein